MIFAIINPAASPTIPAIMIVTMLSMLVKNLYIKKPTLGIV
jgi:hypothetical protein